MACNFDDLELGLFKVIQGHVDLQVGGNGVANLLPVSVLVPIDSPSVTSYSTSIDPNIVSVNVFKIPNLKSLALPIPEI